MTWARGTLSQQPLGYSDIYWCDGKNGPTVYLGKGEEYRKAYRCQLCGQRLADDEIRHDFVLHIEKEQVTPQFITLASAALGFATELAPICAKQGLTAQIVQGQARPFAWP